MLNPAGSTTEVWGINDPVWLGDMLAHARQLAPERLALTDPPGRTRLCDGDEERLTWAEVGARVDRLSLTLIDAGVGKGDIVMTPAPSLHETLIIQLAVARIGAISAAYPIQYREHELKLLVALVRPRAMIGFETLAGIANLDLARKLAQASGQKTSLFAYGSPVPSDTVSLSFRSKDPLSKEETQRLNAYDAGLTMSGDDGAVIIFTSGSSAAPKAVLRSHSNIVSIRNFVAELGEVGDGVRMLSPRLLNTTGAIATGLVPWLNACGTLILHRPFDIDIFIQQIREERPDVTSCPPGILHMLLKRADEDPDLDLSSLKYISSGSAQLDASIMKTFKDCFGIDVTNAYGSSEGAMLLASKHDVPDIEDRARYFPAFGFKGYQSNLPMASAVETRLVSPETGDDIVERGAVGELYFRSPTLFRQYYGDPERTSRVFDELGFYKTGDLFELARTDPPLFRFVGRRSNMIVRGGMNVSAEEIQDLLSGHPAIKEVAAIGRPDAKLGEIVAVVVVCNSGESISLPDIISFLRDECRIAIFKLPQHLELVDELPRRANGKPDMSALRALVRSRVAEVYEGGGNE